MLEEETCLDNVLFAAQDKHLGSELGAVRQPPHAAPRRPAARKPCACSIWSICERYADEPAGNLSFGQRRLLEIVSSVDRATAPASARRARFRHQSDAAQYAARFSPAASTPNGSIVFLIVEHNMEFIMSLASHILVMHQGAVLEQGTPAAIQASQRVIEAYLG